MYVDELVVLYLKFLGGKFLVVELLVKVVCGNSIFVDVVNISWC